ncbi:Polygalacturonase inhibitor 2 [Dichanthelium oligosanthes]|uniref:Polygalacturonase inhibitor 2 n=1 Tax=Dichanthelium oligosanthes TaxID=888268 RepID=A0A1E5US45_9POAL|nr:Polygalacturonase inhibitor 2 [Dichanthelium oligosanthes]
MEFTTNPSNVVTTLLLAVLVLAAAAHTDGALCNKSDKAALLAVKSALGNPPALSGWNSTVACCSWDGISCNATTGRVTELTVFALNISAPIPAAIANLTKLQIINFAYNQLYGSIPAFLGPHALPDLTFLRLDGNRLTGTIPPTVTVFDLSLVGNLLTGPLPATFGHANFGDVDLTDNQLTGDASMLFGAKKQLNALRLSRNRFKFDLGRVELPEVIDILEIDHNMVYGSIPAAAAARKWLRFNVSFNQLCGPIPQGRYTHRFGAKHFAGNKCLCGRPLPPCGS